MMLKKALSLSALILLSVFLIPKQTNGQNINASMFRLAEGFVRIAEPGQLADTLNVWGDVTAPGRYIVPRGTTVHELISYARGATRQRGGQDQNLDWNKLRVEINISSYNGARQSETVENFTYRYNEPYPAELRNYELDNDDILSVEMKRRPNFLDYLRVFSSIVGATATTIIVVDRLAE
ncbi:hypothetical protein [Rhodohalobacter sulfatireducens]|uniref:Soluble ligand binding domain-containing protein n=1 Tax=Rhodohalobacter sulfatireducens TaxID=2911366 RepID=A0ABS9KIU3_9BACT|nr:hypothetical protein [Rhodohalobacter sulfatireducens]MCG2590777.1 hypothetical protein [Rhodohalobacter sulfatireducens]